MKRTFATNDKGRQVFINRAAKHVAMDHLANKILTETNMPARLAASQDGFNETLTLRVQAKSRWRQFTLELETVAEVLRTAVRNARTILPALPSPAQRAVYMSHFAGLYKGGGDHGNKWHFWHVEAKNIVAGLRSVKEAGLPGLPEPYNTRLHESLLTMDDLLSARDGSKNEWNWARVAHQEQRNLLDELARDLYAQVHVFMRDHQRAVVESQLQYYGFNASMIRNPERPFGQDNDPEDEGTTIDPTAAPEEGGSAAEDEAFAEGAVAESVAREESFSEAIGHSTMPEPVDDQDQIPEKEVVLV